jgi:beta-galactosidase
MNIVLRKICLVILLLGVGSLISVSQNASRIKKTVNASWKFHKGDFKDAAVVDIDDSEWETISIPHTWNNLDANDDEKSYYRDICWYRKTVFITKEVAKLNSCLYFEGVNQIADVYVNGQYVGQHKGGYTRFNFDITPFIKYDEENEIAVKVDNSHNVGIAPLSADFTFFGGIYRDVFLLHLNDIHIAVNDNASSGVYITTPQVSKEKAQISIRSLITNESTNKSLVKIENRVIDKDGKLVFSKERKVKLEGDATQTSIENNIQIDSPNLWSPNNPYLYTVITRLIDVKTGAILDEVVNPLGLRWFEFTADKGFFLNGEHLKLMGTNRHQDYLKLGNALPDEMHVRDVRLLKEMGGNFLRISHYPQDPVIFEMCDKLGIITCVEIPIENAITENSDFAENCIQRATEMVKQNFNHPSLMIWAYMNEVLLQLPFKEKERLKIYYSNVEALAQEIENTIRKEDPSRYTMIPCDGNFDRYNDAGITQVPMIIGWNLYSGWYGGEFPDFDKYLDRHRTMLPNTPVLITEYGADVNPRLHSFDSERFDYTVEYGNLFHEHYRKAIMERPFVAGAAIWNLNDFYSEHRGYGKPHVNLKGITGLDREKKDSYWLYKAFLTDKPVVALGQKEWKIRSGVSAYDYCTQPVEVYSNAKEVELFHNGLSLGKKNIQDFKTIYDVSFTDGENILEVVANVDGRDYRDINTVDFRLVPQDLRKDVDAFKEMNVILGSNRYYENQKESQIWIPEQEYTKGSWGYVGGEPFREKTKHGSLPCSGLNILGTEDDPVFQNQRTNIDAYKLDVVDGKYTITLNWAELQSDIKHEKLAYNLGDDKVADDSSERIFNVLINGEYVEYNMNLAKEYGAERAISKKYEVSVTNGKGIDIQFEAVQGETVLNSIRVYKIY